MRVLARSGEAGRGMAVAEVEVREGSAGRGPAGQRGHCMAWRS